MINFYPHSHTIYPYNNHSYIPKNIKIKWNQRSGQWKKRLLFYFWKTHWKIHQIKLMTCQKELTHTREMNNKTLEQNNTRLIIDNRFAFYIALYNNNKHLYILWVCSLEELYEKSNKYILSHVKGYRLWLYCFWLMKFNLFSKLSYSHCHDFEKIWL